jgi:nitrate reductase beta subunit
MTIYVQLCQALDMTTWLSVFNYVERYFVPSSLTEVIQTSPKMDRKRMKTSHVPSSSNTKSIIGQQFSMLLQEDKYMIF